MIVTWAGPALAESAWLIGAQTGAVYSDGVGPAGLAFKLGAGVDWIHELGPTVLARLETTHRLRATLGLMGGWSGPGLLEGAGLPLGLVVGPIVSVDHRGERWWGGRTTLRYSLWYARALLELDVGLEKQLGPDGPAVPLFSVGLVLRIVPIP